MTQKAAVSIQYDFVLWVFAHWRVLDMVHSSSSLWKRLCSLHTVAQTNVTFAFSSRLLLVAASVFSRYQQYKTGKVMAAVYDQLVFLSVIVDQMKGISLMCNYYLRTN